MQEFFDTFRKPKFWQDIVKTALTAAVTAFVTQQVVKACNKKRSN